MLVFVFDPLAVMLLLAANQSLMRHGVVLEAQHTETIGELNEPPQQTCQSEEESILAEHQQHTDRLLERIQHLEEEKSQLENRAPEIKEVIQEVVKEVEVPGPERIVEVPGPERTIEVPGPERVVEVPVEKVVEKIVYIDKHGEDVTDDLEYAAKAWAESEQNTDGLAVNEILEAFKENQNKLKNPKGFWSIPLPSKNKD